MVSQRDSWLVAQLKMMYCTSRAHVTVIARCEFIQPVTHENSYCSHSTKNIKLTASLLHFRIQLAEFLFYFIIFLGGGEDPSR